MKANVTLLRLTSNPKNRNQCLKERLGALTLPLRIPVNAPEKFLMWDLSDLIQRVTQRPCDFMSSDILTDISYFTYIPHIAMLKLYNV